VIDQWLQAQSSLPPERRDRPGDLHAMLGKFYFSAGDYARAVSEYQQALAIKPDAQIERDLSAAKAKLF
jgi:Flp pilus assembly protein TadD